MNTPQTRFITLSAMKVTNTEHTAINGNQSKCRMTQFNLGGALTKSGNIQVGGFSDSFFLPLLLSRIGLAISVPVLPISDAVHCNPSCSALQPLPQCIASALAVHCLSSRYAQGSAFLCCSKIKDAGREKGTSGRKIISFWTCWYAYSL